ncbi:MAG: ABC transporter permease, partial [Cyclobacteriaceae bacterium]|nr:ABC transporter permease [Cyclobacteriaceae bacterium]
ETLTQAGTPFDLSAIGVDQYTVFSLWGYSDIELQKDYIKHGFNGLKTDENFFSFFDFNFLSGQDYRGMTSTDAGIPVVISSKVAETIYGTVECTGKTFGSEKIYRISGVVEPVGPWSLFVRWDIFVLTDFKESGAFQNIAYVLEDHEKSGFSQGLEKVRTKISTHFDQVEVRLNPRDYLYTYADLYSLEDLLEPKLFVPFVILLLLLPTTCMINLFRGLIIGRVEELGVRKSFGAHAGHITNQFIVESMLMTLLSGFLAMLFSLIFWKYILVVDYAIIIRDVFAWRVFVTCLFAFLFTGTLVGYLSSLKLAKGSIVKYLSMKPS